MNILDTPPISTIRRNHGIEHATVHVLTARNPNISLVGRADAQGFFIYGAVDVEELRDAARAALARLQSGETHLAIHPRCGTNLVTAGLIAGIAALVALGRHPSIRKIPNVLAATTVAAFLAQPLGNKLQERVTTSPDARGARIGNISKSRWGSIPTQHVHVEWE